MSMAATVCAVATSLAAVGLLAPTAAVAAPSQCSNADFRKGVGALLPDCRAYEQVSPTDKNGFDIESIGEYNNARRGFVGPMGAAGPATADGNAAVFQSSGSFADSAFGGASRLQYLARRKDGVWSTRALTPRVTPAFVGVDVLAFSPAMDRSLILSNGAATPDPVTGAGHFYLRDNDTTAIRLLAQTALGVTVNTDGAVARDPSHFVVTTADLLTAEPGQPASASKVYEVVDGEVRLVSREPGTGAPFQGEAAVGNSTGSGQRPSEGLMSEDGRHIFFSVDGTGLYRRSDGTTTVLASPSRRTPADPEASKVIRHVTSDGNRLFFTTSQRMTDDANTGTDLYRYDFADDRLVDLTADTPGDDDGGALAVVDASDDGSRVYFVATGALAGGAVAGQPNLYLWEDDGPTQGDVRFIAQLDPTTTSSGSGKETPLDDGNWKWDLRKSSQATSDGGVLAFQSRAPLLGFDPSQAPGSITCDYLDSPSEGQPCSQVYVYDAEADGGAGDLVCVSCRESGAPVDYTYVPTVDQGLGADRPRIMSEDGRRVAFTSPDPLTGRDTNGRYDAYVWQRESAPGEPLAGGLSLISSGAGTDNSYAAGLSADGGDVFFRTRDQLVAQDGDTLADLYTARVGGGLAGQQEPDSARCEADACQGQPARPPASAGGALSETLDGAGNAVPGQRARLRVVTVTRRLSAQGRLALRVRLSRPGTVRALVRSRGAVVARGSRRAGKAGPVTVRMRLSRAARRELRRTGRMRVVVSVRSSGARPRTMAVALKGPRR
jgi:hypothetical protein